MEDDRVRRHAEILMAKHGLFDVCFQEIIHYSTSVNPQLGALLRKLRLVHTTLLQAFPPLLNELQMLHGEEVRQLRKQADQAQGEAAQLLDAAETLEKEAQDQQAELAQLRAKLARLTEENEILRTSAYQRPARKPAEGGGDSGASPLRGAVAARAGTRSQTHTLSQQPRQPTSLATTTGDTRDEGARGDDAATPDEPRAREVSAAAPATGQIRQLSLKQLKEFMELLYASKVRHDRKCSEARLARETMEQHLYTFLNQRSVCTPASLTLNMYS
jgi:hypothetical protein